jgi:hypothetical protein
MKQQSEDLEGLILQRDFPAALPQLPHRKIDFEWAEADRSRRRSERLHLNSLESVDYNITTTNFDSSPTVQPIGNSLPAKHLRIRDSPPTEAHRFRFLSAAGPLKVSFS